MNEIDARKFFEMLPNRIQFKCLNDKFVENYDKAYGTIARALNKQIANEPKTIIVAKETEIGNMVLGKGCKLYKCSAGHLMTRGDKYCRECGQKIDWN